MGLSAAGAVNARGEVAIFIPPGAIAPTAFRIVKEGICLFAGNTRLTTFEIGPRVRDAIEALGRKASILSVEVDAKNVVHRTVRIRAEVA